MYPIIHGIWGRRVSGAIDGSLSMVIRPNYGNGFSTTLISGTSSNQSEGNLFVGNTSGAIGRALLKMDLSSLPSTAIINSAKLVLYQYHALDTSAYNVGVHRSLVEWYSGPPGSEQAFSTWNHRNAYGSVVWSGGAGGASGTEWAAIATDTQSIQHIERFYEFDVTDDVQDFVDGTHTNYGWWIINGDETTTTSSRRFASRTHELFGTSPVLYIEYDYASALSFSYRKKLTVDSSYVSSNLTDFPLLVDLSSDTDIASNARPDLQDIIFTAADGVTRLPYEYAARPHGMVSGTGAWLWFGGPWCVRYVGSSDKTYLTYVTLSGTIEIKAYNHGTDSWEGPFALKSNFQIDDHFQGSIQILSDGKIMVVMCPHNSSNLYMRISTNAEDISAWGSEVTLHSQIGSSKNKYQYPTLLQLTGETNDPIYIFYTDDSADRQVRFSKTEDGGTTWDAETIVYNGPTSTYIYYHAVANGTSRIDFVVSDNTPNLGVTSLYHFYYTAGNYYKSDGTLIGDDTALPLTVSDITLVHDGATSDSSFNLDIAVETGGNPVIAYVTYPSAGVDHRYRYARWNGSAWVTAEICKAGGRLQLNSFVYPGGLTIDKDNPATVYLSRPHAGVFNIFKYTSSDNGATWTEAEQVTNGQSFPHMRPVTVRNGHADLPVVWMTGNYVNFTSYNTALLGKAITSPPAKFWVRVPLIEAAQDTDIYVYYGSNANEYHDTPDLVWYGVYDLVIHGRKQYERALEQFPPFWYGDSSLSFVVEQSGQIDRQLVFPVADRRTLIANINQRNWPTITAEMLVNRAVGASTSGVIFTGGGASANAGMTLRIVNSSSVLQAYTYTTGLQGGNVSGFTIPAGTLYRLACRYSNAGGVEAFRDKTAGTPLSIGGGSLANINSATWQIGYISTQHYTGTIEEIRVTHKLLSNAWLDFVYDNIVSNSLTVSGGTEEAQ